jgi:4-oxalomesaconate hydratase
MLRVLCGLCGEQKREVYVKILVISAHAADFCSRSGGTIAKHVRAGDEARVVALTYGERSESGGLYAGGAHPALEEVKAIRREEGAAAAAILGAEIDFWDWSDVSFEYTQERARVVAEEIRRYRPDVLLTHHGPDPVSVDHDKAHRLVIRAVQLGSAPGLESAYPSVRRPEVFLFEATIPLTELEGFNPDFYVDITDVWEIKLRALQAFHRGQPFLEPWYTDRARLRGFQAQHYGLGDCVYAEAFERTTPWVGSHLPVGG